MASPSPSFSASAFELALNDVFTTATCRPYPPLSAASRATSSVAPTNETSGWVKQAAGTDAWLRTCARPDMFSTAEIPCADAACARESDPAIGPSPCVAC